MLHFKVVFFKRNLNVNANSLKFDTQYDKRRKRDCAYLPFNETQREKPYSVQEFVKKILATSDLFDMFIQSIKFN